MSNKAAIRSCPFCNSSTVDAGHITYVRCLACKAEGPSVNDEDADRVAAIANWNVAWEQHDKFVAALRTIRRFCRLSDTNLSVRVGRIAEAALADVDREPEAAK